MFTFLNFKFLWIGAERLLTKDNVRELVIYVSDDRGELGNVGVVLGRQEIDHSTAINYEIKNKYRDTFLFLGFEYLWARTN